MITQHANQKICHFNLLGILFLAFRHICARHVFYVSFFDILLIVRLLRTLILLKLIIVSELWSITLFNMSKKLT